MLVIKTTIFFATIVVSFRCSDQYKSAVVQITHGKLIGEQRGHYYAFEGIPYAEPPIGDLRFEPPAPYVQKWLTPRNATKLGAPCLQWDHFNFDEENKLAGHEDCLFLNVYTPSLSNKKKMPVFVYFHGGAFMFGHGDVHGPEQIATRNGILVNLNYRLGPLGFLTTENKIIPGNMGMKDQVEALKWVQRNIVAFGGDPTQVTITGFSAGGASVHLHYMSPLSEGLFKNGISHSGCALNPWAIMEKGKIRAKKLATIVGCKTTNLKKMVKCLKECPATDIVKAVKEFQPWLYNPFSPFAPSVEPGVEGAFITKGPSEYIASGDVKKLPWLVSTVKDEGLYPAAEFLRHKEYLPYIDEHWNEVMPYILHYNDTISSKSLNNVSQKIRNHYQKDSRVDETSYQILVDLISDRMYKVGITQAIRAHSKIAPTYFYHFHHTAPYGVGQYMSNGTDFKFGAAHGEDIHLIYSTQVFRGTNHPYTKDERQLIELLLDMYYSFAKTGEPHLGKYEMPAIEFNAQMLVKLTEIWGARCIDVAVVKNFGDEKFWSTLGFDEK